MEIKKLSKTVRRNNITYLLQKREKNVAMYLGHVDAIPVSVEVFKIFVDQPDKFIDYPREAYPSNEEFGTSAWCYNPSWGLNKAELKYAELVSLSL